MNPKLPPGPKGALLLGEMKEVRKDILSYFQKNVRDYPGISRVKMGPLYYVNISNPAYIEHVFLNANKKYIKGRDNKNLMFLLGNGLLTSSGDFWLKQRRLMQPLFHKQRLQGFLDKMKAAAQKLIDSSEWKQGNMLDIHDEMMKVTLDIVSSALMSTGVTGNFRMVSEAVKAVMERMFLRTRSLLRLPYWVPLPRNIRMRHYRSLLDKTIHGIIDNRRQSTEQFDDLLTMLMEVQDADTAERMTDAQLRDELITIYLARHETTANALTFTFYPLCCVKCSSGTLDTQSRGRSFDLPAGRKSCLYQPSEGRTRSVKVMIQE